MRRLVVLTSLLVLVDTAFYAALTPLLPRFADDLGLSKALDGILVAAYPLGTLVGGLPGGVAAARFGPRRAVLGGLVLFAASSVAFGFVQGFGLLVAARLLQGIGSALTWAGAFTWLIEAAPRGRRGEMIGTAMAAAVFGALLGPAIGAAAAELGRGPVFVAVALLGAALAVAALTVPPTPGEDVTLRSVGAAFRNRRFAGGLAYMCMPAILFGTLGVLAPLHLHDAGWSAAAIGAVWIVAAAAEAVQAPFVGRLSDRRGALVPVQIALAASAPLALGLATGARPLFYVPLLVAAAMAFGVLFTPALALIADGAEEAGLALGLAFGLMNAAWAIGAVAGPALAGAVAQATGDAIPFVAAALLCLAALGATRSRAAAELRIPEAAASP